MLILMKDTLPSAESLSFIVVKPGIKWEQTAVLALKAMVLLASMKLSLSVVMVVSQSKMV